MNTALLSKLLLKAWPRMLQIFGIFPYKKSPSGEYIVHRPLLSWSFIFAFLMLCGSGLLLVFHSTYTDTFLLSMKISYFAIVDISLAFILHAFQWRKHGVIFNRLEALPNSHASRSKISAATYDPLCWKASDCIDVKVVSLCAVQVWLVAEGLFALVTAEGRACRVFLYLSFYSLHFWRQRSFVLVIHRTFYALSTAFDAVELPDSWDIMDFEAFVSRSCLHILHKRIIKVILLLAF